MGADGKRAALYLRVSTEVQSIDSQLQDLRRYAAQRDLRIVAEFEDCGVSGKRESRPQLNALFTAAKKRQIDVVLVWSFSRFSRTLKQLVLALEEFEALGVDFVSYSEAIDTSTPAGRVLFAVIAAFAQFEREIIRERVLAGLRAARLRGKRLGRPKQRNDETIRQLRAKGNSIRSIARQVGFSTTAVQRALRTVNKSPPSEGG